MPQCSVRAWCLVLYAAVYRVPGISCQVPRCSTLGEGRGNRQKLKNSEARTSVGRSSLEYMELRTAAVSVSYQVQQ